MVSVVPVGEHQVVILGVAEFESVSPQQGGRVFMALGLAVPAGGLHLQPSCL